MINISYKQHHYCPCPPPQVIPLHHSLNMSVQDSSQKSDTNQETPIKAKRFKEEQEESNPGVIIVYYSDQDIHNVLGLPAVGNLQPPLAQGATISHEFQKLGRCNGDKACGGECLVLRNYKNKNIIEK